MRCNNPVNGRLCLHYLYEFFAGHLLIFKELFGDLMQFRHCGFNYLYCLLLLGHNDRLYLVINSGGGLFGIVRR